MGSTPRGLVKPRVHGPLPGDSEAQVCFKQPASSLIAQCHRAYHQGPLSLHSRCPPTGRRWGGIAARRTVAMQAFRQMVSRELWDDFSRSVFTGEVTPGRAGSMEAMTERDPRGQPCSCAAGGAASLACRRRERQDEALPTHLSSSGTALPPCAQWRPPKPWVTEHVRACLNSGVL